MRRNKLMACLMAGTMAVALTACSGGGNQNETTTAQQTTQAPTVETTTQAPTEEQTTEPAIVVDASVDFEDGAMGFVAPYSAPANASDIELAVVDYNGGKALQVKNLTGKVPFVGIDVSSLCGADVANIASIVMTLGVEYEDGTFSACSGKLTTWTGEDLTQTAYEWSVYLENKNPKTASFDVSGTPFTAGANNIVVLSLETDNGVSGGHGNATLYVDNICFYDAAGKLISADKTVAFAEPEGYSDSGVDYSNLCFVKNPVDSGYAGKADAWNQDGFEMSEEFIAALVPGSVVQIEYTSETGNMWIVIPDDGKWSRVGVGNLDGSEKKPAIVNNSHNIVQIPYEMIAELSGDDVAAWGARMQCESDGAWEVFSVKVGTATPLLSIQNAVDSGYSGKADGWNQDGFEMSEEFVAALVPGSVVEITYSSESGNMWIVMPDDGKWSRVGVGNIDGSGKDSSQCYNGKCYITYEQIAEHCGDDVSAWGARMQCESDTNWEVYSVKVGTKAEFKMLTDLVDSGYSGKADGWNQDGFEMSEEFIAALVPGSVVEITYSSDSGNMWIVIPDDGKWSRVGVGNIDGSGKSLGVFDGKTCQITYEQIAEWSGDDVAGWGLRMQCESDSNWEVYSVKVGQSLN